MGSLDVLNCGAGHLSFSFDKANPLEVEKARRVIGDMLRRGYAIFVEVDGQLSKVESFDAETDSYIVAEMATETETPKPKLHKGGRKRRVPIGSARATGVGPTAGG